MKSFKQFCIETQDKIAAINKQRREDHRELTNQKRMKQKEIDIEQQRKDRAKVDLISQENERNMVDAQRRAQISANIEKQKGRELGDKIYRGAISTAASALRAIRR